MKSNPGKHISQYEVATLFSDAYCSVDSIAKCVSVFKSTGLYPLNSVIFSDEDFQAADNLLQPVASTSTSGAESVTVASTAVASTSVPGVDTDADNLLQQVTSMSMSGADSATVANSVQRTPTSHGEKALLCRRNITNPNRLQIRQQKEKKV